jgi:hypothetical protein
MKNGVKRNYHAIKELLENPEGGLQSIPNNQKNLIKVDLTVEDHQDYIIRIAALTEVCVIALDGHGSFYSKKLSHIDKFGSVTMILEMVRDLLPFDQRLAWIA